MTSAVKKAIASVGGKLEVIYWALGEDDAVSIADFPDLESAAALAIALNASGTVRAKTHCC